MYWRYLQEMVYWGSYLSYPILIGLVYLMWKNESIWYWPVIFLLGVLFVYARFNEPQQISMVQENYDFVNSTHQQLENEDLKVVLISDLHLGVYKKPEFLKRVVEEVNKLNPQLILIAGDIVYDPDPVALDNDLLAELGNLKGPVFAVTGNHDAKQPGYVETEKVRAVLRKYGIAVIDNQQVAIPAGEKKLNIFGLSDLMEKQYDLGILKNINFEENNLILAHNPDAAYFIDQDELMGTVFMVSGHTHGGQVRLPWVYKFAIPSEFGFDRGWYKIGKIDVLVSSGLGETLLPMRLGVPPEIVLLKMKLK